jgi:hypothetical protein
MLMTTNAVKPRTDVATTEILHAGLQANDGDVTEADCMYKNATVRVRAESPASLVIVARVESEWLTDAMALRLTLNQARALSDMLLTALSSDVGRKVPVCTVIMPNGKPCGLPNADDVHYDSLTRLFADGHDFSKAKRPKHYNSDHKEVFA